MSGTGAYSGANPGVAGIFSASTDFGPLNIGQTEAFTFAFSALVSETLGTPQVLTGGAPNLDFTLSSTTCTGSVASSNPCTVDVRFTPAFAGPRAGAVNLVDTNGNILSSSPVSGFGTGPEIAFGPLQKSTLTSTLATPGALALDGSLNVFVIAGGGNIDKVSGGTATPFATSTSPSSLALDGAGNLYFADPASYAVYEQYANNAGGLLTQPVSGAPSVSAVAMDGQGDLYFAGYQVISGIQYGFINERLPDGSLVLPYFGSQITRPVFMAVDATGDIFVASSYFFSRSVWKIPRGSSPVQLNGLFLNITGMAVNAAGDVLVSDSGLGKVMEIPPNRGTPFDIGGGFIAPAGLAMDAAGDLYW